MRPAVISRRLLDWQQHVMYAPWLPLPAAPVRGRAVWRAILAEYVADPLAGWLRSPIHIRPVRAAGPDDDPDEATTTAVVTAPAAPKPTVIRPRPASNAKPVVKPAAPAAAPAPVPTAVADDVEPDLTLKPLLIALRRRLARGLRRLGRGERRAWRQRWTVIDVAIIWLPVGVAQIAAAWQPLLGAYAAAAAVVILGSVAAASARLRQTAITAAILPVVLMTGLALPQRSAFLQSTVLYIVLLALSVTYRYLFTIDQPLSRGKLGLKWYALLLPLMVVAGQAAGIVAWLLFRHHYAFAGTPLWLAGGAAAVFGIAEELYFRGVLQSCASQALRPLAGASLSAALYASLFIGQSGAALAYGAVVGAGLSATYYWRPNTILTITANLTSKLLFLGLLAGVTLQ